MMSEKVEVNYKTTLHRRLDPLNGLPNKSGILSAKVYADLVVYNSMIDEWANGLLSLKIDPEDCNIKTINQKKKKFYWIHWKRGTKGIKHYANMMLDHLEKEQREANGEKVESQKEGE